MDLSFLKKTLEQIEVPKYRKRQIQQAYFKALSSGWEEVGGLPKDLRKQLSDEVHWDSLDPEKTAKDKEDGSIKTLFRLNDGSHIESVLIRHRDGRRTVCVSSQVGCPLGCLFCATGQGGYKRNLEAHEIFEQVIFFARKLKEKNEKVTNVVFMGMGEPLLNYQNIIQAIRVLNDKDLFNLGARHISISTIGIPEMIKRLAKEDLQVNLAFSLHAPDDKLRSQLIPYNKKHKIRKVMDALDYYIEKTHRRVMVEYLMIDHVNDSKKEAEELVKLFAGKKLYYLNLINYNLTKDFKPSPIDRVKDFVNILEKGKVPVTIRHGFGGSISAACGQLAGKR